LGLLCPVALDSFPNDLWLQQQENGILYFYSNIKILGEYWQA
jgi:hypothetical protein